ncbi:MAG: ester cyclase [Pseudomonadota bacterium]
MGIASNTTQSNKERYKTVVDRYAEAEPDALAAALREFLSPEAAVHVVQPINTLSGEEFGARILEPMQRAFRHLHRRSDMLFGGEYQGTEWVVSHGHYAGWFDEAWLGIPPSKDMVWLHYVEYHRMQDGHSVESYLYFDMQDLLRQIGIWVLPPSGGYEGFVPGPATADGIALTPSPAESSAKSLQMVDDMLSRLYTDDQAWRPYWHRNMVWYGPSGYGSFIGVDGFARFQLPYEAVFERGRVRNTYIRSGDAELDSKVSGHYARFADGNYVASGGWPSHGGFLANDWLGVAASGQMFTVRVADIWRRAGDRLVENWVFVDVIDMLLQLDVDVFAEAGIEISV